MQTPQPLDAILFDPLSWMHPQRLHLAPALRGSQQRSVINSMIINALAWSNERPAMNNPLTRQFIEHWCILPQITLLIACQRHRAELTRQGRICRLPSWVRPFAELALVDSVAGPLAAPLSTSTLLSWGKHELLVSGKFLPNELLQRVSLLFSPDVEYELPPPQAADANPLLLKLAFQYAKTHPAIPNAAEFWRSVN